MYFAVVWCNQVPLLTRGEGLSLTPPSVFWGEYEAFEEQRDTFTKFARIERLISRS